MTSDNRKLIQDIMDSESMGYAYVYPLDGGPRKEYLISLSPENMANFIGKKGYDAEKILRNNADGTSEGDKLSALTQRAFLVCAYGGLIEPISSGQEEE